MARARGRGAAAGGALGPRGPLDALIFAAGFGTRLGALGLSTPKALLEVAGQTMLERTARRLVAAGADRIVVNAHHHADRIERFVAEHDLGAEVLVSREAERPLETGGGLLHARDLLRREGPILLHNVDVITDADLGAMVEAHRRSGALATLAVSDRPTSRYLLFDEAGLFGREDRRQDLRLEGRPPRGATRALAFAGIHVCSPQLLDLISERGVFPIVDVYLRLAAAGETIVPWLLDGGLWLEIGNAERLEAARALLERTKAGG
jgi:N-acetyl-alpha-D-muramate 1-phosphate uridylyltransferase